MKTPQLWRGEACGDIKRGGRGGPVMVPRGGGGHFVQRGCGGSSTATGETPQLPANPGGTAEARAELPPFPSAAPYFRGRGRAPAGRDRGARWGKCGGPVVLEMPLPFPTGSLRLWFLLFLKSRGCVALLLLFIFFFRDVVSASRPLESQRCVGNAFCAQEGRGGPGNVEF